jgi:hypothetical protein
MRQRPGYMPHLALSAPERWWYFRLWAALLRHARRPIWHVPAALFAAARLPFDRAGWNLSTALCIGLGCPLTPWARLRLLCRHCYQRETELLIAVQSARLTTNWAQTHIPCDGQLPPHGAILVAPHHYGQGLSLLALASRVGHIGMVGDPPPAVTDLDGWDPTMQAIVRHGEIVRKRIFGDRFIRRDRMAREGLSLLREGGYLNITSDSYAGATPLPLLGRTVPQPRGASWLARRSGMPIVPYMTVPWRGGWRLWIGAPLPPTPEGVRTGIEEAIRRAPQSWLRPIAMGWLDAPVWTEDDGGRGTG